MHCVAMAQPIRARTRDTGTMHTFDARTIDSTGAFLLGELERLDQVFLPIQDLPVGDGPPAAAKVELVNEDTSSAIDTSDLGSVKILMLLPALRWILARLPSLSAYGVWKLAILTGHQLQQKLS
jgi:hypothetical protein